MSCKVTRFLNNFNEGIKTLSCDDRNYVYQSCGVWTKVAIASKVSKHVHQQAHLQNCDKDASANIDENNASAESFQELEPSRNGNAEVDKAAESFQELEPSINANAEADKSAATSHEIPVQQSEERKHFRVLMDVHNFLQKELDVKVLEKYLVIHGKHEFLTDEHGTISREFTRRFEIPEGVDVETFRALVDDYDVLTVEASFKPKNVKVEKLDMIIDPNYQTNMERFEDLGQVFKEVVVHQIKDAMEMVDFMRKLREQRPSKFIPLEL